MPISRFEPATVDQFYIRVAQEAESSKRVFAYFFASEADPTIERVFENRENPSVTLLKIPVGQKDVWRAPDNMWRVDETLKLKYVPTLVEFDGVLLARKLVEAEIWEQEQTIL